MYSPFGHFDTFPRLFKVRSHDPSLPTFPASLLAQLSLLCPRDLGFYEWSLNDLSLFLPKGFAHTVPSVRNSPSPIHPLFTPPHPPDLRPNVTTPAPRLSYILMLSLHNTTHTFPYHEYVNEGLHCQPSCLMSLGPSFIWHSLTFSDLSYFRLGHALSSLPWSPPFPVVSHADQFFLMCLVQADLCVWNSWSNWSMSLLF